MTAPDGDSCDLAERWARPLRAGRLIKVETGGKMLSVDGVDTAVIDEINAIYE